MKKQQKTITEYSKDCPKCKKRITGYSESQVVYNLRLHLETHKGESK